MTEEELNEQLDEALKYIQEVIERQEEQERQGIELRPFDSL